MSMLVRTPRHAASSTSAPSPINTTATINHREVNDDDCMIAEEEVATVLASKLHIGEEAKEYQTQQLPSSAIGSTACFNNDVATSFSAESQTKINGYTTKCTPAIIHTQGPAGKVGVPGFPDFPDAWSGEAGGGSSSSLLCLCRKQQQRQHKKINIKNTTTCRALVPYKKKHVSWKNNSRYNHHQQYQSMKQRRLVRKAVNNVGCHRQTTHAKKFFVVLKSVKEDEGKGFGRVVVGGGDKDKMMTDIQRQMSFLTCANNSSQFI